ncbi:MAG TPA: hypothetical protein VFS54_04185 [Solirubrobacterales bacterium]|nr:hypothetical protein [Solirubrobacterales bacterium]
MKHIKTLGLLAFVAAVTMALAASASADRVTTTTSGGTTDETPTIHMVNESTHVSIVNTAVNISCTATLEGTVTSHEAGKPASVHVTVLPINGCTNSWHVTTISGGSISFESSNGEVISSGLRIQVTRLGTTCVFETTATKIGTITGGSPATLHIEAALALAKESSPLCGSSPAKWEGSLVTTEPLHFDNN